MKRYLLMGTAVVLLLLTSCNSTDKLNDSNKKTVPLTPYQQDYKEHLEAIENEQIVYEYTIDALTVFSVRGQHSMYALLDTPNEKVKVTLDPTKTTILPYDSFMYKDGNFFVEVTDSGYVWVSKEMDRSTHIFETVLLDYSPLFKDTEKTEHNGLDLYVVDVTMEELILFDPSVIDQKVYEYLDETVTITAMFDSETNLLVYFDIDLTNYIIAKNEHTSSSWFDGNLTYLDLYYSLTLEQTDLSFDEFTLPVNPYPDNYQDHSIYAILSKPIQFDQTYSGSFEYEGDKDVYYFEVTEETTLSLELSTDSAKSIIIRIGELYSSNEEVLTTTMTENNGTYSITLEEGLYAITITHASLFNSPFSQLFDSYSFILTEE